MKLKIYIVICWFKIMVNTEIFIFSKILVMQIVEEKMGFKLSTYFLFEKKLVSI